jgi:uncharacterized protein YdcH (DUF465 family)
VNAPVADVPATLESLLSLHQRLDERLRILDAQLSLTSSEQLEYAALKKQKLHAKDRIARLQASGPGSRDVASVHD